MSNKQLKTLRNIEKIKDELPQPIFDIACKLVEQNEIAYLWSLADFFEVTAGELE
jgi:hypothetical protein